MDTYEVVGQTGQIVEDICRFTPLIVLHYMSLAVTSGYVRLYFVVFVLSDKVESIIIIIQTNLNILFKKLKQ